MTRPPGDDAGLLAGLALLESVDPPAIAAAIAGLLDDPSAQDAAAEAASRAAQNWSWDGIVSRYATLYGEVLRDGRGR